MPASAQIRTSTLGKQYQFTLTGTFLTVVRPFALGATGTNGTVATVSSGGAAN